MRITFVLIGIIGLIVLIYSIILLFKQIKLKEIAVFDLVEKPKEFVILKSGIHSICLIGLNSNFKLSGLEARLSSPNGKDSTLKENRIKYSYFRKGEKTFEQWNFKSDQIGIHKLNFKYLEDFLSRNQFITSTNPLRGKKVETKSLKVLIKQSVSIKARFITIFGLVLGVNGLFWGIMMIINPNTFA